MKHYVKRLLLQRTVSDPRQRPKQKNHPLLVVCSFLFNVLEATLHIWRSISPYATWRCAKPSWQRIHLTKRQGATISLFTSTKLYVGPSLSFSTEGKSAVHANFTTKCANLQSFHNFPQKVYTDSWNNTFTYVYYNNIPMLSLRWRRRLSLQWE